MLNYFRVKLSWFLITRFVAWYERQSWLCRWSYHYWDYSGTLTRKCERCALLQHKRWDIKYFKNPFSLRWRQQTIYSWEKIRYREYK